MGQRLAAMVMAFVAALCPHARAAGQSEGERTSRAVAAFFDGHGDETIDAFLMRLRPAPLDEASRARLLASLPREGEVRPSRKDDAKLSDARRVLDYSSGSGATTIRVVAVDSAFVGLYFRAAVLVSTRALALLTGDELAALVAHEAGHEPDWDAYWAAMQAHDSGRMRELELKADGIAVLTLERLGIDPERLPTAIRKMVRYNDWQDRSIGAIPQTAVFGVAERYVPMEDRLAFIRTIERLRWADWPADAAARPR